MIGTVLRSKCMRKTLKCFKCKSICDRGETMEVKLTNFSKMELICEIEKNAFLKEEIIKDLLLSRMDLYGEKWRSIEQLAFETLKNDTKAEKAGEIMKLNREAIKYRKMYKKTYQAFEKCVRNVRRKNNLNILEKMKKQADVITKKLVGFMAYFIVHLEDTRFFLIRKNVQKHFKVSIYQKNIIKTILTC